MGVSQNFYLFDSSDDLYSAPPLSYFKTAGWETEWIDTAEAIVHAKFEHSYTASDGDKSVDDELIKVRTEKRVS